MKLFFTFFKKDLRVFVKNFYGVVYALLMGLLIIFLLSLGLADKVSSIVEIASVVFWIASFFALMVLFRDLYRLDRFRIREELMVAGIDVQVVWLTKTLVVFMVFLLIQFVFLGATTLFLDIVPKGSFFEFFLLLFLIDMGLVCLSSLFSAMPTQFCTESVLVLILFPLQIPLLLGGIKANIVFFNGLGYIGVWWKLIISCDIIFVAISLLLFPHIYNP